MSAAFDPYHVWLGIPPQEQPPHHYRLLGVPLWEADPRVIESAADRQMTFLRTFQSGPHGSLSQKILNEVAQARVCLLSAVKKAPYDEALRAQLAADERPADQPLRPIPVIDPISVRVQPVKHRPRARPLWQQGALIGGPAALLLLAAAVVFGLKRTPTPVPPDPRTPMAQPAPEVPPPDPMPEEVASRKRLLMLGHIESEFTTFQSALKRTGLAGEVSKTFDKQRDYLADYDTILTGANWFDFYNTPENRDRAAFGNLEQFVEGGGHLVVFGNWNGRNMANLSRYGIKTGNQHTTSFERVGESTDLFFAGSEEFVPPDGRMTSAGNLTCRAPHVVLLKRGPGKAAGQPAVLTLEHQKGRVTVTLCEPHWRKDYWLIHVMVGWIARGCPTPEASSEQSVQ